MFDMPQMLKERALLQQRLSALNKLIQAAAEYQASQPFPPNPVQMSDADIAKALEERQRRTSPRAAPVMQATEDAVSKLLTEKGKPVPLNEIIYFLMHSDVQLPSHNINNVVSARLSNSKKFEGRRGIGWWFADRPWPGDTELALDAPDENEASTANGDASETRGGDAATSRPGTYNL